MSLFRTCFVAMDFRGKRSSYDARPMRLGELVGLLLPQQVQEHARR